MRGSRWSGVLALEHGRAAAVVQTVSQRGSHCLAPLTETASATAGACRCLLGFLFLRIPPSIVSTFTRTLQTIQKPCKSHPCVDLKPFQSLHQSVSLSTASVWWYAGELDSKFCKPLKSCEIHSDDATLHSTSIGIVSLLEII